MAPKPPSPDELAACLRTLEALAALSHNELADLPEARPVIAAAYSLARRAGSKLRDPAWKRPRREEDLALLAQTGLRKKREGAPAPDPPVETQESSEEAPRLGRAHKCYVCRASYRELDRFYDRLCPACAAIHHAKRAQTGDLRGRVAFVTGGRVRIGYAVVRKLLRFGATVLATTRYPALALQSYAREPDYEEWRDRLRIEALDLRDLPALVRFADALCSELPRLDLLVNNAAHTVDHPPAFFEAMAQHEERAKASLPSPGALVRAREAMELDPALRDERERNTWRRRIGEIAPAELLSVHAVNALAPFLLVDRLRPLLTRGNEDARFVLNVTAAEGRFYQHDKTVFHPHTNMAKAALNMLTRTVGDDLAAERVYALSVDPGWVSSQLTDAGRERAAGASRTPHPPLDEEDGAARVLDPVFSTLAGREPRWGVLLRHFEPVPW